MPDSADPQTEPPASTRTRRKLRLPFVVAVATSSVLFACAGCCFLTTFLLRPQFLDGPSGADEIASHITDWTLPTGFSGKMGAALNYAVLEFDVAKFQHRQGRGSLVIGQLKSKYWQDSDQSDQARKIMEQLAPELKKINFAEQVSRTLTIRGLPAKFELGRGEDRASVTKYREVIGHFRGKQDDAILILQYEEGVLSDEEVDEFLKSIK